jgi:L-fuconolactonase
MRIDAHQHFWKYDAVRHAWITEEMNVLRHDYYPVHLGPLLQANRFNGCVAVQADQSEGETEFLLHLADEFDFIKGVVGWTDLRSPLLKDRLSHYRDFKKLKGFRHVVQAEPSGFLTDKAFIDGVRCLPNFNFTYDLLIYHYQLEEALAFVEQVEGVPIIVDHLAKPSIRTNDIVQWKTNLKRLASFRNVSCKISGMVTEADWTHHKYQDFVPYMDVALECFGSQRMIYGSDWPVCLLAATYERQLRIVEDYIGKFSKEEQADIMGRNASRFYNL